MISSLRDDDPPARDRSMRIVTLAEPTKTPGA